MLIYNKHQIPLPQRIKFWTLNLFLLKDEFQTIKLLDQKKPQHLKKIIKIILSIILYQYISTTFFYFKMIYEIVV